MIRFTANILLYLFIISGFFTSSVYADYTGDFKKHAKSIYLLHSVKPVVKTKKPKDEVEKRKGLISEKTDTGHIQMLSYIPEQSVLLPFDDIKTIVSRIETLTKRVETTKEGEESQSLKFDMAYEYFLLYLHYLNVKYGMIKTSDKVSNNDIPVRDKELEQYLSLSEYYLKSFISDNRKSSDVFVQGRTILKSADDVSFKFRQRPEFYLNAYFLAMMLECEKLAGEWGDTSQSSELSSQYDKKTWNWLDTLWKRHFTSNKVTGAYTPTAKNLFAMYELYMRYHFLGRYLRKFDEKDPLLDSQARTLLNRLAELQKEADLNHKNYYAYYSNEATKDSNNTEFLVNLYLARRGFIATQNLDYSIPKEDLFNIYRKLYDDAAAHIKYNIAYRSIIYNELILFGIGINNLRLMEDVLYEYGQISMRLQENEGQGGTLMKNSSRLTMAFLLANILDKKRGSGLDRNSDIYRDIAETLTPILISKDNNYWEYAAAIQSALAMFYSRKEGGHNEALAMYHAKRAFLVGCEKVYITYDPEKNGWLNYFKLPNAEIYLKLFTEFQKKYQTSPDAVMPKDFNSYLILKKYQDTKKQ